MPTVTVITPTYQASAEELERCLGSIRAQTFTGWHHIVCSDGPDEPVARATVDRQAQAHRQEGGWGTHEYRSTGRPHRDFGNGVRSEVLDTVDTDFVCFLDDDNLVLPAYLDTMISSIEAADVDFAVCACLHYGPIREDLHGPPPQVLSGVPPRLYAIDTMQVVARTSVMRDHGFAVVEPEWAYYADGLTYESLAATYAYVSVPDVLTVHL